MLEIQRVLGTVAGVGGIGLGVTLFLLRDIIRKSIFSRLTKEQSYRLMLTIVVGIFVVAIASLVTYGAVTLAQSGSSDSTDVGTRTATAPSGSTATARPSPATQTPAPPSAPTITVPAGLDVFEERTQLIDIASGATFTLKVMDSYHAPVDATVSCATGVFLLSWQVRSPFPGGDNLEIASLVPQGGGRTQTLARGASGSTSVGYCDVLSLVNHDLKEYRVELRYISARHK